ncbi:MAG: hypothetical protein JW730_18215 [Anaerolineales bacterium]|nr:hypothetical protein [Anaerolineales bacterium]
MASDNRLELVINVDSKQGNASIKSVNKSLSGLEDQVIRSTKRASSGMDGMTASMVKGVLAGNALFYAAKKAFDMLKKFTLGAIETQDMMAKTAQKLGMTVEEFSSLHHVSELAGMSTEQFSSAVGLLSKNMLEASRSNNIYRKAFQALGIEYKNTDGSLRGANDVLEQIADQFRAMPDNATKTAFAMELLGRSGKEMIPFLNQGSAAIRDARTEAGQLGRVISAEAGRAAEHFNDNLTRLKGAVEGLSFKVAEYLLPRLTELTDRMLQWAKDGGVERLAAQIKQFAEWAQTLGKYLIAYALVTQIIRMANAVRTLTIATKGLNVAMLANPWGLAAVGIAIFGTALWNEYGKIKKTAKELEGLNKQAAVAAALREGKTVAEIRKKYGLTDEQMKYAVTGGEETDLSGISGPFGSVKGKGFAWQSPVGVIPSMDENADKLAKFIHDANKAALEFRKAAEDSLISGAGRQIVEVRREIEKLTTFIDDEGISRKVQLSAEARANIEQALQLRIRKIQEESAAEAYKKMQDAHDKRMAFDAKYYIRKLEFEAQLAQQQRENAQQLLHFEEERAAMSRDAALRQLEGVIPHTIEQKAALEARKADIEIQYIQDIHKVKIGLFEQETAAIMAQLEMQRSILAAAGQNTQAIAGMIADLKRQRDEQRAFIDEQTQGAIDAAKENAAIRQYRIIQDEQARTFDSFKRQAEGVFDALLTRSRSVFGAIADIFKTTILTAIKEIVSSSVARLLTQMFGGLKTGGASAGTGGAGFSLAGLIGLIPGLGGAGGMGGFGTPPFVPGGAGSSGGGAGGAQGLLGMAGMPGGLAGLKDFIGMGGANLQGSLTGQGAFSVSKLMHSNAAVLGGGLLALAGVKRGGLSGLGMTTAGGAMIGYKYGGALGAAIGGAIGLGIGIIGLFRKSAEKKAREKIKATYGVDIKDKGILKQIVEMAKQGFGGNLDMAIRSQQIRELIELYALTTGQNATGMPAKMQPAFLAQSGGSLYSTGGSGALPGAGIDQLAAGSPSSGPMVINITVPGAKEFFEKETVKVVVANPRSVQDASLRALISNSGRRELTSLQLSPGTLTS